MQSKLGIMVWLALKKDGSSMLLRVPGTLDSVAYQQHILTRALWAPVPRPVRAARVPGPKGGSASFEIRPQTVQISTLLRMLKPLLPVS